MYIYILFPLYLINPSSNSILWLSYHHPREKMSNQIIDAMNQQQPSMCFNIVYPQKRVRYDNIWNAFVGVYSELNTVHITHCLHEINTFYLSQM